METDTRHRVGVYAWVPPGAAGADYFRTLEPIRVLAATGNNATWGIELSNDILSTVDTVMAHQIHSIDATEAWHQLAKAEDHRLVLDIDDAMWVPDWKVFQDNYTPEALGRLFSNVERAHVITTPNAEIAAHLSRYNPNTWVVPNTVPAWLLSHQMPPRPDGELVIGYQGSTHHVRDITGPIVRDLGRFLARNPDWHLHTYGPLRFGDHEDHPRVHNTPWVPGIEGYWRTASFHVGIGPLRDTRFNRSKSGLRALEYAALGIVPVLPHMPFYEPYVRPSTGYLYRPDETLGRVLQRVVDQPDWLIEAAAAGRLLASQFTTELQIERWLDAWHSQ